MIEAYLDIPDKKKNEFSSGAFGVNRNRLPKDRVPNDEQGIYEAFALYFHWAMSLEDPVKRENAMAEGEFALQDLQTEGALEIRVGSPEYTHYEQLPVRVKRVDTVDVRRRVYGVITQLVFDPPSTTPLQ